jgi:simple sugar transport system permease protein
MRLRVSARYIPLLATAAVLAALYTTGCLRYPNFGTLRVVVSLLGDNSFLGIAAIGATFVILSGGIDLSVGAMIAFVSTLVAVLVGQVGLHPLAAVAVALLAGSVFGAAMGGLIQAFRVPAFLVTLAGMFLARGLAFVIHPQSLGIRHPFYGETVNTALALPLTDRLYLPFTAQCFFGVVALALYVAHFTRFGRNVYALGDDENSALLMGLPVARTRVLIYTLAGFCSALAGVVFTFYMQSGNPAACVGFELDAIAAVVIGGTLLSGGVGYVGGTVMGVLILGLIQTIITFQGDLNAWWTKIVVGLLVLAFIALQNAVSAASRRAVRS